MSKKILLIVGGQAYPPNVGGTPSILYSLLKNVDPVYMDVLTSTVDTTHIQTNKKLSFNTIEIAQSPLLGVRILWRLHVFDTMIRYFFKSFRLLRNSDYDSAVLIFPETAPLLGGWIASKLAGKPYHLYIIDLMAESRIDKIEWTLLRLFENTIMAKAQSVFALTQGIKILYNNRVKREYVLLPHIAPDIDPDDAVASTNVADNTKTITFSGQVHEISLDALQNLIRAIRLIHETEDIPITVQIFTNRSKDYLQEVDLLDTFVNVRFFSNPADLLNALSQSDILFSPVAFNPRYPLQAETCFPTKTFDYIKARRPILVHGRASYFYTQYMQDSNSAYIVDEFTPEALKTGILQLLNDQQLQSQLVENAAKLANTYHTEDIIRKRFEQHVFGSKEIVDG